MTDRIVEAVAGLTRSVRHPVDTAVTACWELLQLPAQSWQEIRMLKAIVSSIGSGTVRVFEWGMGNSTVYYPSYLRAIGRQFEWHAVDNSRVWYERVWRRVRAAGLEGQVHLACSVFPRPFDLPGCSMARPACLGAYPDPGPVLRYIEYPKILGMSFDLLLVDGRFRRRCLLLAREVVRPDGIAVLHDAHRAYYQPALSGFPVSGFVRGWRFPGSRPRSQMWIGSLGESAGRFLR